MDKKKIIIIIIVILLLACLGILLFGLYKKNNNNNKELEYDMHAEYLKSREEKGETADDAVPALVNNYEYYYTVKNIIDSFNTNINYLNSTVNQLGLIVTKGGEEQALAEYKAKGVSNISNMLGKNYKTKYSVDADYIEKTLKPYANKQYTITSMYIVEDSAYINTYFVYGEYEGNKFNYIVVLDRYNSTFEVYLDNYLKDNSFSADKINSMRTIHVENIEANNSNEFQYKVINENAIVNEYFNKYMQLMKKNPSEAYKLLDSGYREKRFKDENKFSEFVSNVMMSNDDRSMKSYTVENSNGFKKYLCQDAYGNYYLFKCDGVFKYTVILDTYTVEDSIIDVQYNEAKDAQKAQLSFNRFLECINNQDYESAYKFLNDEYKAKNFKSVEEFKNYVKSNWPLFVGYTGQDLKKENENYVFSGFLYDRNDEGSFNALIVQQTFILKLGSNVRDFQISFNK